MRNRLRHLEHGSRGRLRSKQNYLCSKPQSAMSCRYNLAGVIFHLTRCGLTLLMNALRQADRVIAVSEAPPMDRLLRLGMSPSPARRDEADKSAEALVTLFAHYLDSEHRRVVVKCGIQGLGVMGAARRIWPDVPFIILVRNPIEVVVSNIRNPARWMLDIRRDPGLLSLGEPPRR